MSAPATSPTMNLTPNPLLAAALAYAARGWAVFPLQPGGKKPMAGSNGFKDATIDHAQIEAWWTKNPDANIGIATGAASGISVLDVDVKAWENKHGNASLRGLTEQYGALPDTPVQVTWSGGFQYI